MVMVICENSSFHIDKHEVNNEDFAAFLNAQGNEKVAHVI